jgi:hypothetical protein
MRKRDKCRFVFGGRVIGKEFDYRVAVKINNRRHYDDV